MGAWMMGWRIFNRLSSSLVRDMGSPGGEMGMSKSSHMEIKINKTIPK
jgi:hypothetical protein